MLKTGHGTHLAAYPKSEDAEIFVQRKSSQNVCVRVCVSMPVYA